MGVSSTCHTGTELLELVNVCWMCECYDKLGEGKLLNINCRKVQLSVMLHISQWT